MLAMQYSIAQYGFIIVLFFCCCSIVSIITICLAILVLCIHKTTCLLVVLCQSDICQYFQPLVSIYRLRFCTIQSVLTIYVLCIHWCIKISFIHWHSMIVKTESPEQFCLHAFFFQKVWTAINISLWYYYVNFIQSFHQFWLKRNSAKKVRNIYTILFSLLTVSN